MDKLNRGSSLHKIVSSINEVIDVVNSYMGILKTLDNSSLGEQVVYSSTQDANVTGEVFTVKIPGLYTLRTSGSGTTSVLIQRSGDSEVSETVVLYTSQESEELLLSSNDKLLFYVTTTRKDPYSVHLTLKAGLFSVVQDLLPMLRSHDLWLTELKSQISNSIESYTKEYESLISSNKELQEFANEQLVMMNNTIRELSNKVNSIQG